MKIIFAGTKLIFLEVSGNGFSVDGIFHRFLFVVIWVSNELMTPEWKLPKSGASDDLFRANEAFGRRIS